MTNIKLSTPVKLPKGIITRIIPDEHFEQVHTSDDLEDFTALIHEIEYANHTYQKLTDLGGPDILLFRTYQKLQNAIWRLYDKYPVHMIQGADPNGNHQRTVNRPGDILGCRH